MNISIDLLKYVEYLKVKSFNQQKRVFDPIRQKDILLTPEETVRQLMIHLMHQEYAYPMTKIAVEKAIQIGTTTKRFDLLFYNQQFQPHVLVECKAPKVLISESTFRQAAWYNFQLHADYLIVTNGTQTYCCLMDYEKNDYTFQQGLPKFK
ncbi:MAG: type I restriction enzyme HsdR N-terminal domain-containing protein [Saprospiraceae bacterium]|nr:type I restriction enzyme HsdR N-terminal domain-containing protein [Saprospiraceae bacterium]